MATTIYALTCEFDDEIRYVGRTTKSLRERLTRHLWQARKDGEACTRYLSRWIRANGYAITIRALETVEDDGRDAERDWIARLRHDGAALVNTTRGGEGMAPGQYIHSPEHRAAISAANRRRFEDPAARARIGRISRERVIGPEERAARAARATGKRHTAESRAKMSAARKGVPKSPQTREKIAAANRVRAAQRRGVPLDDRTKQKLSAALKGRPKSEETKMRMREAWARRKAVI